MKTRIPDAHKKVPIRRGTWLIIVVLLLSATVGLAWRGGVIMGKNVLTESLSEPLNGTKTAAVTIDAGIGHLTIDKLNGSASALANGTLQYLEKQGRPTQTLNASNGQAALTLKGGEARLSWFRFPWEACAGAYEWQIHLNPTVASDITAHSDGGNVTLNLATMNVTRVMADTGGGNMDLVLPDAAANLSMTAKTGAGNVNVEAGRGMTGHNTVTAESGAGDVSVYVPSDVAVKVHATSGLGKVIVDSRFSKIDANTYQSPDYDGATDTIEITINSGMGNVRVTTR
jgi:hypothetical protein